MVERTTIFISSSAQETLVPIRNLLRESLTKCGHNTVLYEYDIGLYSDDTLESCLQRVRESDILILFISNKAGSFTEKDPNITATYAEFLTALEHNTLIIPIVEQSIFQFYHSHIHAELERDIKTFILEFDREPAYTYSFVKDLLEIKKTKEPLWYQKVAETNVDPFIWAFIHDIYVRTPWTYTHTFGLPQDICDFIGSALSQVLKQSVPFYTLKDEIEGLFSDYDSLMAFQHSTIALVKCIAGGTLDIPSFLKVIKDQFIEQNIYKYKNTFSTEIAATVSACQSISIYEREGEQLHLLGAVGCHPAQLIDVKNSLSMATETYTRNSALELVYYQEEKQHIYISKRTGELIIIMQFELSEKWSEKRVKSYESDISEAIMQNRGIFDLAIDLAGGILNG
ncbi:DUF4062 domain-containing protein [Bacillus sp. 1P06AnD]|uniref:DUF4062 domain-containing protein n=1 Tax=Bacillus sp. 1P06AnD TaxID=3132208 RepID=UPI0039A10F8A